MNQFVAPTSFITSISRRRANIADPDRVEDEHPAADSRSGGEQEPDRRSCRTLLDPLTTSKANTTS